MQEARNRESRAARAAARSLCSLEDADLQTGLRKDNRRRQPVWAGTDDDCVAGFRQKCRAPLNYICIEGTSAEQA